MSAIHFRDYLSSVAAAKLSRKSFLASAIGIGLLSSAFTAGCVGEETRIKAFPTAEGFGAYARGGRGGSVYEVDTLADDGKGSLRACVDASGPRTCVFRIGGTIAVNSPLLVSNPYLTIAGQTATGDGILLRNADGMKGPTLSIQSHNVIVRHLRIRPGPSGSSSSIDAIQVVRDAYDVIIDHTSMSWAADENLDIGSYKDQDPYNVTVQWSIIAEGLDFSVHSGARKHSKGILLGSGLGGRLDNHFTLHHNLIAHNRDRMPDINNAGITDYVNNVMYNPKSIFGEFYGDYGENYINFVGNYMKKGPDTSRRAREIDVDRVDKFGFKLYLAGNIGPRRRDDTLPEDAFLYPEDKTYLVDAPLPAPPVATTSAEDAYRDVLEKAGATVPKRDPVDARIVTEVEERSGRVPNHPDDVGGYPDMRGDAAPLDTDQDGMSDEWEQKRGLDLYDPGDRNGDADGNGYTDLEDYLNELAGDFSVAANSR